MAVPAAVPSLFQSSVPWLLSDARKKRVAPIAVKLPGSPLSLVLLGADRHRRVAAGRQCAGEESARRDNRHRSGEQPDS